MEDSIHYGCGDTDVPTRCQGNGFSKEKTNASPQKPGIIPTFARIVRIVHHK